ncbi:PilW family protein [Pseudomonas schmalbachii]|uniref:Pilus assembly protein PilW n=1 Tax=Pseudomonas schmalbachii TaxID=2816993 RepID=A0ABS3TNR6_9PSED|nr:hypothetical protein [Pseudomonas schmalbachii]MBO3275296.1 hypothetical protein [Pseudomonas schmalbachii]
MGQTSRTLQTGLSLIELMVALLLSCFLILGVTQVYVDDKQHYLFQQNQIGNEESSRFAALFLQDILARAGYRAKPQAQSMALAFPARGGLNGCPAFDNGEVIKLTADRQGICIRYQRGMESKESDCTGAAIDFSETPINVLTRLSFTKGAAGKGGEISCSSVLESGGVPVTASVLGGVLDMHISAAPGRTMRTQAVLLSLLFASDGGTRGGEGKPVIDKWNELTSSKLTIADSDRRIFRISQNIVTLRNLTP